MNVREILEQALEAGNGYGTPQMYETRIREALATLDAEGEGLPATDALYGFAAWLTCREESVTLGANHDAAGAAELVSQFVTSQSLPELSDAYPGNLKPYPLPGQGPEPSAGLREAVERVRDMLRVRQALEPELTAADLAGRAADRLDAALRAEEGEA
jgi:hypothetical protein